MAYCVVSEADSCSQSLDDITENMSWRCARMVEDTLEAIAMHRYGSTAGLLPFLQIALLGVGTIDCVLARHVPMRSEIEDFVLLSDEAERKRPIKRLQLEAVCKLWDVKSYIVVGERQYDELTSCDGASSISYNPDHFVRLVVCRASQDTGLPSPHQFASVAGDAAAILQLECIDLPSREEFSQRLSNQLRRTMLSQISAMIRQKEVDYALSRCLPCMIFVRLTLFHRRIYCFHQTHP